MDKIIHLVQTNNKETLNKLCQYNVYTSWYDVDYGGCKYGIFSAAMPIEALHSLENGLIADMLDVLFKQFLIGKNQSKLDSLTKQIVKLDRQYYMSSGAQKDMPTLLWKNGISTLSFLKAHEKVGIMLTIIVLSLTTEGITLFDNVLKGTTTTKNMQEVFQMMLAYWSWLKKPTFWKRGDIDTKTNYVRSIRLMLTRLKNLWPREKGQGWFKAKYHEQLHVPDDIERNGAPSNTHTGPTEHNHLFFVKNPAKRSQRRQMNLDEQVANRYSENYIIHAAYDAITNWNNNVISNNLLSKPTEVARCLLCLLDIYMYPNNTYNFCVVQKTKSFIHVEEKSFGFFAVNISSVTNLPWQKKINGVFGISVQVFTEYKRHDLIFRSHPYYRFEQPWFDWVMVRWSVNDPLKHQPHLRTNPSLRFGDETSEIKYCYTPCKLLGYFFKVPTEKENVFNYYAVVWCAKYQCNMSSVFSNKWEMEFEDYAKTTPKLEIINCDSIVRHCCMIPNSLENYAVGNSARNTIFPHNMSTTYHELWPKEIWGTQF
jgi:hypothetical protein